MHRTARARPLRSLVATILVTAAMASGLAGCAAPASSATPAAGFTLHVDNGSTMAVDFTVNGTARAAIGAGGTLEVAKGTLGAMPWAVQLVSPAGSILAEATVDASLVCAPTATGGTSCAQTLAFAHLACGDITLWAGDTPPPIPPIAPGTGLPCD